MFANEVGRLRKSYNSLKTRPIAWRKKQLLAFLAMLKENREELCDAIWKDLHKNPAEAELMELTQIQNGIVEMLETIDDRSKVENCKRSLLAVLNKVRVIKEPYGVVLIIGAWNFPYLLSLNPLVGAVATGNCAVIKPSELSPATADVIKKLIPRYLDPDCFTVITGGVKESSDLINNHKFDLIFYTGGSSVGKIVMQAAAKTLTPVILELGGKNPCYIDKSCDLDSTARRLAWGKWVNAGQACVAADFVLCEDFIQAPLIEKLKVYIKEYFGEDPHKSDSYGRIINERHLERVKNLLEGTEVVHGGQIDESDNYFAPTIVVNIAEDAPIRQEEVFGPILPLFTVKNLDEAIDKMNEGEHSLQMSVFASDRNVIDRVVAETTSGGITVNEFFMQNNESELPFGGVGCSGIGKYHGSYSFDAFTQKRSYYECCTPEFINKLRYPPYTSTQLKLLTPVAYKMGPTPKYVKFLIKFTFLAGLGALIAYTFNLVNIAKKYQFGGN